MPDATANGIRIHYEERGEGDPLVLIMGLGADGSLWEDHVEAFEQHFRCILMDNRGIGSSFHPNSPPGSIFRIEEDYKILLDALDANVVGFAPDAGHIANGGMDPVEVFRTYRPLIRHAHFKDMARPDDWAPMGEGVIDFPALVRLLNETGFDGWIMVEEESVRAETEPDAVTVENGEYVRQTLMPIVA